MKISIKNPCHEDWNTMQPNEHGAFCLSCVKNVIDFTSKSLDEIKSYFSNPVQGNVCARFKEQQLQELSFDHFFEKFSSWRFTKKVASLVALTVVFWLSGSNKAFSQKEVLMGKPSIHVKDTTKKSPKDTVNTPKTKMGMAIPYKEKQPKSKNSVSSKTNCAPSPKAKKEEHILMGDVER